MAEKQEILVANLTLDTYQKNNIPPLVIPQGDYGARVIRVRITEQGRPVTVTTSEAASIVAERSGDGESKAFSGTVNEDGTVNVPVTQWMLDLPDDDVICHVVITGNDYQYSTTEFLIEPKKKTNPTEISKDDPRQDIVTEILANESARQAAEATRRVNETGREAAEDAREEAESKRLQDEELRTANEALRVTAESEREAAEDQRAAAESERAIAEAGRKKEIETLDQRITKNEKRLTNIEQGVMADCYETDDSVAYVKDVPTNALPYAAISKVGGMTRKCANLIPFPYNQSTITNNGVTYTVNADGSVLANGTATEYTNSVIYLAKNITFPAGTYTFVFNDTSTEGAVMPVMINGALFADVSTYRTITLKDGDFLTIYLQVAGGASVTNLLIKPRINPGSTALPHEPYFEGLRSAPTEKVESVGKNLASINSVKAPFGRTTIFEGEVSGDFVLSWDDSNLTEITYPSAALFEWTFKDGSVGSSVAISEELKLAKISGTIVKIDVLEWCDAKGGSVDKIQFERGTERTLYAPFTRNTLPIPAEIQALDGYGLGVNESVYNYIDYEKKQFVVRVGVVDLGTLNWYMITTYGKYPVFYNEIGTVKPAGMSLCSIYDCSESIADFTNHDKSIYLGNINAPKSINVIDSAYTDAATFKAAMSGVMLYYELDTPEVTDISDILSDDNLIGVEGGGTITMVNEHEYAVPSEIIYQLKGVSV